MWLEGIRFLYSVVFFESAALLTAFLSLSVVLTLAVVFSHRFRSGGVFFAVLSMALGGVTIVLKSLEIPMEDTLPFFSLLALTVGVTYLLFFTCVRLSERKKRIKAERETQAREMRYTLPQKDNTFIRARLNAVSAQDTLRGETEDEGEEIKLRFTYAKTLLEKLRAQSLTVTERLETDELANVFAVYAKKETYVGEDVRLISEAFSRVLKLAAKYGV